LKGGRVCHGVGLSVEGVGVGGAVSGGVGDAVRISLGGGVGETVVGG